MSVFIQLVRSEPLMKELDLGSKDNLLDALYFGIGLVSTRGLSYELPFDIMLTILSAERIKRDLGLRGVNVLIADEHTKKTSGYDSSIVDRLGKNRRDQIIGISDRLGLRNWVVHLASEVVRTPEYQEILSELGRRLPFITNPYVNTYVLMELADMEWFRRTQGTDIKLGWTSSVTPHDERWFDGFYRIFLGQKMTFPYTKAGRTVRGNAVPPYLHIGDLDDRLLLRSDEQIEEKFERMPRKVQKYYEHLTDMFVRLGYSLTTTEVHEKIRETYEVIL